MPWLHPALRRPRPGRGWARGVALAVGLAQIVASPMHAVSPVRGCPEDDGAPPPSEALALKNAAQELRAAGSFAKAARYFRDAVEELPACAAFADERLRWSLWAAEMSGRAGVADDGELLKFLDASLAEIESTLAGRELPDYLQLVATRDDERAALAARPRTRPRPPAAPRGRDRVGLGLMAGGAPLVVTGAALLAAFSVKANRLSGDLAGVGGLYTQWSALDCSLAAQPGEPPGCADLRARRSELRTEGLAANRVVVTSIALLAVGAALALAGLAVHIHGLRQRRRAGAARLRVVPAGAGLVLHGSF